MQIKNKSMWLNRINSIIGIILIFALSSRAATTKTFCEVPIGSKEHYRLQWPLIFSTSGELYATTLSEARELKVQIADGAEVLISCGPNYLKKFYKVEVLSATCNGVTGNFRVNTKAANIVEGTEMNIKDLTCDLRVIEEVLQPVDGCAAEKFTATRFGYVEPLEKTSIVLGEVCYDMAAGKTLWAHVKLGKKAYLQQTDKSYLTANQHPDGRYKIDLFRGLHFDELYERIRTQLHTKDTPALKITNYINGPLLSNAQFKTAKKLGWNYFVTYDDLDVMDTLKTDIHMLGKQLDLDLYMGSHGVHTLHGDNGMKIELYLHAGGATKEGKPPRFPVPQLVWLLVRQQNRATVFGVFNDAAVTKEQIASSALCKSECEKVTWLKETMQLSINHRPLICCSYADLRSTVKELPELEGISELLL